MGVGVLCVNGFGQRLYDVDALDQVPVVGDFHADVEDVAADHRAEIVQQQTAPVKQLEDDGGYDGNVSGQGRDQ